MMSGDALSKLEAVLGKSSPADIVDIDRWRSLDRSGNGECCGKCGEDFLKDEPIYRRRSNIGRGFLGGMRTALLSYCDSCAPKICDTQYQTGKCDVCARTVHYPWDFVSRWHLFCSVRCSKAHYARVQREKRLAKRRKTCNECGRDFLAPRSDSKFCSSACKQRAYRDRKSDASD